MRMSREVKVVTGQHERPNFLVAIPTLGIVPIEFVIAFSRLQMPINALVSSMVVSKTEVGVARNYVGKHLLQLNNKPKYLLFIGDDMLPPWDGVIKLYQEMETGKWDILSGLYFIKQDLPIPIIWRKDTIGYLEADKHYNIGEVVWVDVCGMDFTIIRRDVFERLEYPWFKTGPSIMNNKLVAHTEDVYFCDLARKAKMNIGVHTGVRVGHYSKTGEVY